MANAVLLRCRCMTRANPLQYLLIEQYFIYCSFLCICSNHVFICVCLYYSNPLSLRHSSYTECWVVKSEEIGVSIRYVVWSLVFEDKRCLLSKIENLENTNIFAKGFFLSLVVSVIIQLYTILLEQTIQSTENLKRNPVL